MCSPVARVAFYLNAFTESSCELDKFAFNRRYLARKLEATGTSGSYRHIQEVTGSIFGGIRTSPGRRWWRR